MRAFVTACSVVASLRYAAAQPAPAGAAATARLSTISIARLQGCWRVRGSVETWTFQPAGRDGLRVVRELGASANEAERARIPQPVVYKDQRFRFVAAGRIHALGMVFSVVPGQKAASDVLEAAVYTSHDGTSYMFTGTTPTLGRCTTPSTRR